MQCFKMVRGIASFAMVNTSERRAERRRSAKEMLQKDAWFSESDCKMQFSWFQYSCDHPRSNPLFGLHCLRRPKKKPALPTGGMGFLPQVRASLRPRLQRVRMSLDEFRGGKEVTKCEQTVTKLNIAEDEHVKYANFIQSQLQFVVSNSFKNIVTGTKADDKYHFSRHGGACASGHMILHASMQRHNEMAVDLPTFIVSLIE